MAEIPVQGTPSRAYTRNPTLLPNFDKPVASGSGTVGLQSPAAFIAANPRVNASATATIGGTTTTGDILTLEMTNNIFKNVVQQPDNTPLSNVISHSYTVLSSDSVTSIAEAFAKLFNDDSVVQGFDIEVDAVGAVLTFNQSGPVGNFSTLSAPIGEASKITIGGTALTNDAITVLFSGSAFSVVAPATDQATIAGTPAATDTVPITFTNSGVSGLPITKTYTVVAGDTVNTIAIGLAALISSDTTLSGAGISAYAEDGIVFIAHNGAIGNNTVLTSTPTHGGGGSETCTFSNGGDLSGGLGVPGQSAVSVTYATITGNSTTQMATGLKNAINANAALAALSVTATSSGAVVSLAVPATAEPAVITSWVNTIIPLATITGSVAAGDVLNITITNSNITGGSATVSTTALLGATTSTLAAALAAAVNANQPLAGAGISATSLSNVVSFVYQAANGPITFSQSVSPGSETITLSTAPTETVLIASKATETIVLGSGTTGVVGASATALVTGTSFITADTVALTFTNAGVTGFPVTVTYTLGGSDTAATIAAGLNTLINTNTKLLAANVSSSVSSATLTITQQGVIGNTTVLTDVVTGTGDEAITFTPSNGHLGGGAGVVSGALTGGSGPIIVTNNFSYGNNGQTQAFWYGKPEILGYDMISSMVAQGMPII